MIDSEIRKRWDSIRLELLRRKRLDPKVYNKVVSALASIKPVEADDADLFFESESFRR